MLGRKEEEVKKGMFKEIKKGTFNGPTARHFESDIPVEEKHGIQIQIEVSSELAAHNLKCLCYMIGSIKETKNTEELNDLVMSIGGYVTCCVNSDFISEKAAEELLGITAMIAQSQEDKIKDNTKCSRVYFMAYEQREGANNGCKKAVW